MKLPKVESLIITVFFFCIALWAISKCSAQRSQLTERLGDAMSQEDERPVRRDTVFVPQPQPAQQSQPVQPQNYSTPQSAPAPSTGLPKLQNPPPESTTPPAGAPIPGAQESVPKLSNQTSKPSGATATTQYSTLFITIDGLKLRKEPNLKSSVVTKLKLDEQVFFLNKKSEKPEEINLGYEKVTDYWVKIRTKSGKEGWVFGAGVHYYKMKRKGVME